MDNKKIQSILHNALEKKIPSSEINLWQAVKTNLVAGKRQGEKMNTNQPRRIPRAAFALLIVIALLALALITPQGRAFAQSILQFFVRSESDTFHMPTAEPVDWVDVTPGVPLPTATLPPAAIYPFADDCGNFGSPTCSVEQIRDKVDFTVKELRDIPEGMYFVGATGGPDNVFLDYRFPDRSSSLLITVERWTGRPSPYTDMIGASATVEKVKIGNLTGEYFTGYFVSKDGETDATWDPSFGGETLRWVEGDISYRMEHFSFQTLFGKEGMAALAESMTADPVAKLPMPAPTEDPYAWDPGDTYNLSISEAEQQAGFKLLFPTQLPEIFSIFGASYDSESKVVSIFLPLDQNLYGQNTNGLVLREQAAPSPADSTLGDITIGDYNNLPEGNPENLKVVPADAKLETVQIGDTTGKYVEGVWSGTDCCGWVWDPIPNVKTLRWWKNGVAFELAYWSTEIEKADMIRIAESIE